MGDLHDDVKAAFDSSIGDDSDSFSSVSPPSEVLPPVTVTSPDVTPSTPAPTPGRDQHGRFTKPAGEAPVAPVQPQQLGTPAPQGEQPGTVKLDPSKPPSAWTPAMKERWGSIPLAVREEITRREEATVQGVQRLQQQYEPAEYLLNEVGKYNDYFEHIQADPIEYLNGIIQSEQTLRLGNPAQKLQLLLELGDQYGVPLRSAVDQALNGQLNQIMDLAHKKHQTPTPLPPEVAQELYQMREWRSNLESHAAQSELQTFAADHPLLSYVREPMAQLIESGIVQEYQDAYDMAVYLNPQLRAWSMANQNGQTQARGVHARQAAAAGLANPGSAPLETGDQDDGGSDDIHAAVRRAWNSSAGRT